MKKIWNIFSTVLTVCLVLILLFNVICYIKREKLGDPCPTVLGLGVAVVESGSMEPDIMVDDLVLILAQKEYHVHDVVTYRGEGKPVTHEVIEKRVDENGNVWYTTQGTANNKDDGEIAEDRMVGRVILVVPQFAKAQRFFLSPKGLVTLTLILIAIIALRELLRVLRCR